MVDSRARTKQSKAYKQGEGFMEWALLPYKRYAEFTGRSRRMEYWSYTLFNLILMIVIFVPALALAGDSANLSDTTIGTITIVAFLVWIVANIIPNLALQVRRWHDLDQSGWFVLLFGVLGAIPVVGALVGLANIVWFFMPGTMGTNKYGADPKGIGDDDDYEDREPPRPIARIS
jgi:uncharacterized membrane protein YhaH (DUF805 family)